MTEPLIVKIPPLRCSAEGDLTYNLKDIQQNDQPAQVIESAHKTYTLKTWNSDTLEYTYTRKDTQTMTAPTPTTPDRMTAAELRAAFERLDEEMNHQLELINQVKSQLDTLTAGIQTAASASTQPHDSGEWVTFPMETLTLSTDEQGKPTYKARGGQFTKFGVRIWPEVLPALGLNFSSLAPGMNQINPPVMVRALLGDTGQPRKVTGKA